MTYPCPARRHISRRERRQRQSVWLSIQRILLVDVEGGSAEGDGDAGLTWDVDVFDANVVSSSGSSI